jgi:uncharacterized membrane protein YsdA (DUF1294 family)
MGGYCCRMKTDSITGFAERDRDRGGRITPASFVLWLVLLALPVLALQRHGAAGMIAGTGAALVAVATFFLYRHDKNRARTNGWRVSERTLHFFELVGGWPGAFLAQRFLRHKCSKVGFQAVFWLIVVGYQLAALDSLQEWRISRAAVERLSEFARSPKR